VANKAYKGTLLLAGPEADGLRQQFRSFIPGFSLPTHHAVRVNLMMPCIIKASAAIILAFWHGSTPLLNHTNIQGSSCQAGTCPLVVYVNVLVVM
jgi:hypothetical protein